MYWPFQKQNWQKYVLGNNIFESLFKRLTPLFDLGGYSNRFEITLPSHVTHFALGPQDPTEYCHQWSPMLDLQVTFMVRPAQKQCSLTMITQDGWIAFLSKQKEWKNALLHYFYTSGLACYLSTLVSVLGIKRTFSPALSNVSKIHELYDKY